MMDPRHHNQHYAAPYGSQSNSTYVFNGSQNESFNAFLNAEDSNTFDPSWNSSAFPSQAQNIDHGFEQNGQNWQHNAYQSGNLFATSNPTLQPREYDSSFSRSQQPYYGAFEAESNQSFANSAYDNSLTYGPNALNERFNYASQQPYGRPSETISPQALTNYANQQPNVPLQSRQVCPLFSVLNLLQHANSQD